MVRLAGSARMSQCTVDVRSGLTYESGDGEAENGRPTERPSMTRRRLAMALLLSTLSPLLGCMTNTVRAIGHRAERLDRIQSVARHGDELVVLYTVDVWATDPTPCHASFYRESRVAEGVPRWGVMALNPDNWDWSTLRDQLDTAWDNPERPPKRERPNGYRPSNEEYRGPPPLVLKSREGPPPQIQTGQYETVPISWVDWCHQRGIKENNSVEANQRRASQMRQCIETSSLCVNLPHGSKLEDEFLVVTRGGDGSVRYRYVRVLASCSYFANWATPVRAILLPFGWLFDFVTLPVWIWYPPVCM